MVSSPALDALLLLVGPLNDSTNGADVGGNGRSSTLEAEWTALSDALLRIRQLGDDWDGQGAAAPDNAVVDRALEWLGQMRRYTQAIPPSQVAPGVMGEVILEWQCGLVSLSAELSRPDRIEWMLSTPGKPGQHWVTEGLIPYFVASAN